MPAASIIEHLKKHGQLADWEIASATKIPLAKVQATLESLSARGEVSRCSITRFVDGERMEGMLCRISGSIPPKAPGRKPSA